MPTIADKSITEKLSMQLSITARKQIPNGGEAIGVMVLNEQGAGRQIMKIILLILIASMMLEPIL